MKTHTPGPWKAFNCVGPRSLKNWHIQADDLKGRPVATIADIGDGDAANANLIAAAPDLLAALEQLVEEFESRVSLVRELSPNESLALHHSYEAIAKAKGQQ